MIQLFKRTFLLLGFFLLHFIFTSAQTKNSNKLAEQLLSQGDSLLNSNAFDESILPLKKAASLFQTIGNLEKKAVAHNKLALGYKGISNHVQLKKHVDSALQIVYESDTPLPRVKAKSLEIMGYFFKRTSKLDDAITSYQKALETYSKILKPDNLSIANINYEMAIITAMKSKLDLSNKHLNAVKKALDALESPDRSMLANYYDLMGRLASIQGNQAKAIESLKTSLEILRTIEGKEDFKIAGVEIILGIIYYNNREYHRALRLVTKALPRYEKKFGQGDYRMNAIYSNLAKIYSRLGEFHKALEYNRASLRIVEKKLGKDHVYAASTYSSMAATYDRMENYQEALKYYQMALTIYNQNFGPINKDVVFIHTNIGRIKRIFQEYDDAIKSINKSLSIGRQIHGEDNLVLAFTHQHLGEVFLATEQYELSLENFKKALLIRKKSLGDKNLEIGLSYQSFAEYYNALNDFEIAIDYLNQGLDMYSEEFSAVLKGDIEVPEMEAMFYILDCLNFKGLLHQKLYLENKEIDFLKSSKEAYAQADKVSLKLREFITSYDDKISLSKKNSESLGNAVETEFILYNTGNSGDYLDKLFYYIERDKANTLSEASSIVDPKSEKGFSKILDFEKDTKSKKVTLLSKIREANEKEIDSLKEELFQKNREHDSLIQFLRKTYPSYYTNNYETNYISLESIQKSIAKGTTVLGYFLSNDFIYAYVVSKTKHKIKRFETVGLIEKIKTFKSAILTENTTQFKNSSLALYNDLVRPVADDFSGDNLVIVPHKELWNIDFGLLLTSTTETNNPKKMPYLLKKYAISYLSSASLLHSISDRQQVDDVNCLAFSYSADTTSTKGSLAFSAFRNSKEDLPGTRAEIKELSKLFEGDYFFGSAAVEENFKNKASNYRILHLALHGEVNHEDPKYSRLFFTKAKESIEDNYLHAYEIANLDLPSDLAVLSACDTGSGKLIDGEGVMSLGNAFQYAGTKSLLLSKWEVSDKVAPEIVVSFYKNLKNGMTKSKALQKAKLDYLTTVDGERSLPYYWGSFYILGDDRAIASHTDYRWVPYLLLGGFVLFLGLVAYSKKRV